MQEFIIEGGHPVSGTVRPQGNKNEALPVLCAALMNPGRVVIHNVPDIEDIRVLVKLLQHIGADVERLTVPGEPMSLAISTAKIHKNELPAELTSPLRGSVTLLGPLLARTGKVFLPRPGGDKIGRRRVDTHMLALGELGAQIEVFKDGYRLQADFLIGTDILLDEASVTGTENAIMAAALARGKTIIENAASEPHVQGLCAFLQAQGVTINNIGSNCLEITGVEHPDNLRPAEHTIGPDYLEIGSFLTAAAITGGKLVIQGVRPRDLRMIRLVFGKLGIEWNYKDSPDGFDLVLDAPQKLAVIPDIHGDIPKLDDAPWPAFPADLISIALVAATQVEGTVLIHEKLFESRLFFTDKLIGMGARIVLCDPHRAVVMGRSPLHGDTMSSPDIRAGMALVIAALAAKGRSVIQNILQIDRGYERIDERLRSLGASIQRVSA